MPRPKAWEDEVSEAHVQVVALANPRAGRTYPGWTSYINRFGDAPDVEVMCGGINTKTTAAAALWRQGNLLHFGFEEGPDELNATGDALLENAIHYIARFTEDRPIARTPSVFVIGKSFPRRASILKNLRGDYRLDWLQRYLGPEERAKLANLGRAAYADRFEKMAGYCGLNVDKELTLDRNLQTWGVRSDDPEMIARAVAALAGDDAERGRRVLSRYVSGGAGANADAAAWARWWKENRPYVFFSEMGQHLWYVDTLAKRRGIRTAEHRGPSRADASAGAR